MTHANGTRRNDIGGIGRGRQRDLLTATKKGKGNGELLKQNLIPEYARWNSLLNFFIEKNKNKVPVIIDVLELTVKGKIQTAKELLRRQLPFDKTYLSYSTKWLNYDKTLYPTFGRKSTILSRRLKREIFKKDFYYCRYSGLKMIAPGVLELMAAIYYDEFPYQFPNGKHSETHQIVWDLGASPDYIIPITHHNDDTHDRSDNLICCSGTLNMIVKNRHPLKVMGWEVLPLSSFDSSWEGGEKYLQGFAKSYPEFFQQEPINDNHKKLINASLGWLRLISK